MWFTWHDWITEVLFVPAGFMLVEKALVSVNVSYRVCTNVMSNCAFQGLKAVQEFFPWTLIIYLCAFFCGLVEIEMFEIPHRSLSTTVVHYIADNLHLDSKTANLSLRPSLIVSTGFHHPSSEFWRQKNRMFVNKKMVKSSQVVVEVVVFVVFNVLSVSSCWCSKF